MGSKSYLKRKPQTHIFFKLHSWNTRSSWTPAQGEAVLLRRMSNEKGKRFENAAAQNPLRELDDRTQQVYTHFRSQKIVEHHHLVAALALSYGGKNTCRLGGDYETAGGQTGGLNWLTELDRHHGSCGKRPDWLNAR